MLELYKSVFSTSVESQVLEVLSALSCVSIRYRSGTWDRWEPSQAQQLTF